MQNKLEQIEARYEDLAQQLSSPKLPDIVPGFSYRVGRMFARKRS